MRYTIPSTNALSLWNRWLELLEGAEWQIVQESSKSRRLGQAEIQVVIGMCKRRSQLAHHLRLVSAREDLYDDAESQHAQLMLDVDPPLSSICPGFCLLSGDIGHRLAVVFDMPTVKLGLHQASLQRR